MPFSPLRNNRTGWSEIIARFNLVSHTLVEICQARDPLSKKYTFFTCSRPGRAQNLQHSKEEMTPIQPIVLEVTLTKGWNGTILEVTRSSVLNGLACITFVQVRQPSTHYACFWQKDASKFVNPGLRWHTRPQRWAEKSTRCCATIAYLFSLATPPKRSLRDSKRANAQQNRAFYARKDRKRRNR